jgi:two-component system cell cycle sensor histidine kinase/response regulator CckA
MSSTAGRGHSEAGKGERAPITAAQKPAQRADEVLYEALFGAMTEAFAVTLVLYDKNGAPCDFVFVRVNEAFEQLFGIPDPVGRKASEVDPRIRDGNPDLVEICTRVAATGVPERSEGYYPHLDKWIEVRASRPTKDHLMAVFEDITERRRSAETLRRTLFSLDQIGDYPLWLDPDGRIIEVSESTCRHLEYTRDELLNMTVFDIDPSRTRKNWNDLWKEQRRLGSLVTESVHRTKSGRLFPVEVSVNYVTIGDLECQCSFCRDITQRRQTEESLLLTQVSVDRAADMVHWTDSEGRLVYSNQSTADRLGYSREELQSLHLWDIAPDLSREQYVSSWVEGAGVEPVRHEGVLKTKDGRVFPVEVAATSFDLKGRLLRVHTARDISDRKQAEQLLKDGEARYRQLFELESDAIILVDDESGRLLEVNQAATTLYGYSRAELLRMRSTDLSAEPDQTRLASREKVIDIPLRWHRKKDGTIFPVEGRGYHLEWKGHPIHVVALRDITERRRIEESLRLTQFSVDHAPDLIHWLDSDGRFVYANRATCELLGYSQEELRAMHIWDVSPSGTPETFAKKWRFVAKGQTHLAEEVMRTKDGREFVMEVASTQLQLEGRELGVAFVRDISERKQAEQSLRDSEERYRQLFELESDAIVLAEDESGIILEVNQAATTLYGYSRAELLALKDTELLADPEQIPLLAGDSAIDPAIDWHRKKDGTVFPVETRGRSFEWKGQPVHVAAVRDISERKLAADELEESRQMLQLVLDTVPLRIAWRDRDLRYLGCNIEAALDARLPDPAAIVDLRDEDLPVFNMSESSRDDDREVMATGVPKLQYEEISVPSNGTPRILRTSKVPLRDRRGQIFGVLCVYEDVTEQTQTLKALQERDDQLRQSQKMEAVGRLAGGIAHDFNNVLTTIIGYSDLILSAPDCPEGSLAEDIGEIKAAAERAGGLTRQILAFSRRQALQPAVLSLNTVVSDTERLLARTLGADIELRMSLSPDLGPVEVDEHQFVQVLLNLAVNARDAMPKGGVLTLETANVHLDKQFCETHPDTHPGPYAMLTVSDTGTGMEPDTLAHAFEPFYTTKPPGEGTGLGLSTVYGVVAQSGGCIYARSEPGQGTTFTIYLPRVESQAAPQEEGSSPLETGDEGHTIMVVEDDSTFLSLAVRVLERRGYRILPVSNGHQAVAALGDESIHIDLLLTDIVLPGSLQGDQIAQVAASKRPGLPVLFMSAHARDTMIKAGRVAKQAAYLEKPFTAEELASRVRTCLSGT